MKTSYIIISDSNFQSVGDLLNNIFSNPLIKGFIKKTSKNPYNGADQKIPKRKHFIEGKEVFYLLHASRTDSNSLLEVNAEADSSSVNCEKCVLSIVEGDVVFFRKNQIYVRSEKSTTGTRTGIKIFESLIPVYG